MAYLDLQGYRTPAKGAKAARRKAVEAEIEMHLSRVDTLLARLDRQDGDCDLEDDDPAGGDADDIGEPEEWRFETFVAALPAYGLDQSRGPLNTKAVNEAKYLYSIELA